MARETSFTLRIQGGKEEDRINLAQSLIETIFDEYQDNWPEWCKGILLDFPEKANG